MNGVVGVLIGVYTLIAFIVLVAVIRISSWAIDAITFNT